MQRRSFFASIVATIAGLPFLGRFAPHTVTVPPQALLTLWYENEKGEIWVPNLRNSPPDPPPGFIYQWSRFPTEVHEHCLTQEDGKSREVMAGTSGYSVDLVMALTKIIPLDTAILVAVQSCERCMNALAHEHGLTWGYRRYSAEWKRSNTRCLLCDPGMRKTIVNNA